MEEHQISLFPESDRFAELAGAFSHCVAGILAALFRQDGTAFALLLFVLDRQTRRVTQYGANGSCHSYTLRGEYRPPRALQPDPLEEHVRQKLRRSHPQVDAQVFRPAKGLEDDRSLVLCAAITADGPPHLDRLRLLAAVAGPGGGLHGAVSAEALRSTPPQRYLHRVLRAYAREVMGHRLDQVLELSAMACEGGLCPGRIAFLTQGEWEAPGEGLAFSNPPALCGLEVRQLQRCLAMTAGGLDLLVAGEHLVGLGTVERTACDFAVEFSRGGGWTLRAGEFSVLFSRGRFSLAPAREEQLSCGEKLGELFATDVDWAAMVADLVALRRPALLIVCAEADAEAARLCAGMRGMATSPAPLPGNPALLKGAAAAGGAAILDPQARCHAVGVALDGVVIVGEEPARSARYNAVRNYVANQKMLRRKCAAVMISEEGVVDCISTRDAFSYVNIHDNEFEQTALFQLG